MEIDALFDSLKNHTFDSDESNTLREQNLEAIHFSNLSTYNLEIVPIYKERLYFSTYIHKFNFSYKYKFTLIKLDEEFGTSPILRYLR